MGGRSSRIKGHSYERKIANLLKPLDPTARRNIEETQIASVDIKTKLPFGFQLKCLGRWSTNPHAVYAQAKGGCNDSQMPICIVKITHKEPDLVFLSLDHFLELITKIFPSQDGEGQG